MTPYADRFVARAEAGVLRHCGHTMGTPGMTLRESLELFAALGFGGAELRCAKDGCFDVETAGPAELDEARRAMDETGVRIVCLTPYYREFHGPGREATLAGLRHSLDLAAELGCPLVRAYGGHLPAGVSRAELVEASVTGLREAGDAAGERGVCLAVETHGGTLTYTAAETLEVVGAADHSHVGVLLDYPWIWRARAESPEEAVALLAPYLVHVHVKGWTRTDDGAQSALIGQDEVPWPEVVTVLKGAGYGGWYSHEYEKHWYPDLLPEPAVGFANDRDRIDEYAG